MSIKTFSVNLLILVYWSALLRVLLVECVRITGMSEVQAIENGSPGSVTLDCQFEFDEDKDSILVLKWFHIGDPYPIYQWLISKNIRQYSGKIESFVDKDFSVDDELTQFRAIRLISPTIGLNGTYECSVHSLDSHDIRTTELIVYEKAESLTMKAIEVDNGVNITCVALGVFPEPKLSLFRISQSNDSNESNEASNGINSIDESEVKDKTYVRASRRLYGKYDVTLTAHIYEDSYAATDVTDHYECRLNIENTDYMDSRNLAIQSGWHTKTSQSRADKSAKALPLFVFLVFPLLAVINIINHYIV